MPRAFTETGIVINFGGTSVPAGGGTYITMGGPSNVIQFGTSAETYIEATETDFQIVSPGRNIYLSSEYTGTIHLYAGDSRLKISVGTASSAGLVIVNDQGAGTLMTLDGSGNLKVKGTLGTGQTF